MRGIAPTLAALTLAVTATACGEQEPQETAARQSENTPSVAAAAAQPPEFAQCRSCHSVEPGRNGIGPTLHGLMGSKAGEAQGFAFSAALRQSGITWDRASLDQWLAGPVKMVPGTRMVFAVPDPARRKAIVDYIETLK